MRLPAVIALKPVISVLAPGLVVYGVQPGSRTTGQFVDGTGGVIANLTLTKDKVARLLAWVDKYGRFSAPTKLLTIKVKQ